MNEHTLLRLIEKEQAKLNNAPRHSTESFIAFGAIQALASVAFEAGLYDVNNKAHNLLWKHLQMGTSVTDKAAA